MKRTLILIALILPTLILAGWAANLAYLRANAPEHIVKIAGYDPRDLLHGRYLIFRYDWETAIPPIENTPTEHAGRFYLPEDMAPIVESLMLSGQHDFAVRIHLQNNAPHIRDLLINNTPWQEWLAHNPPTAN